MNGCDYHLSVINKLIKDEKSFLKINLPKSLKKTLTLAQACLAASGSALPRIRHHNGEHQFGTQSHDAGLAP